MMHKRTRDNSDKQKPETKQLKIDNEKAAAAEQPASPQPAVAGMYQLNDDCLESIFQYVPELDQQVQVSRVCQRFRDIFAQRIWRRKTKYQTFVLGKWRHWLSRNDLAYFVRANADSIRTIVIDFADFDCRCNTDSDPNSHPDSFFDPDKLTMPLLKPLCVKRMYHNGFERLSSAEFFRGFPLISSKCLRNNVHFLLPLFWKEFSFLHKLIYYNYNRGDGDDDEFRYTLETLAHNAKYTPQLQILCLLSNVTNGVVLEFVHRCPLLQHLDVSYSKSLDESLLYRILSLRKFRQCGAVRQSLTIYLKKTAIKNLDEKFWAAQQQFIKLERSRPYEDFYKIDNDLEFEFDFNDLPDSPLILIS